METMDSKRTNIVTKSSHHFRSMMVREDAKIRCSFIVSVTVRSLCDL